jgi:hypothetical protein
MEYLVGSARGRDGAYDRALRMEQRIPGFLHKKATRFGQFDNLMIALEQAQSDQRFEFHDSSAECRLLDSQASSGTGEVEFFRQDYRGFQQPNFWGLHSNPPKMNLGRMANSLVWRIAVPTQAKMLIPMLLGKLWLQKSSKIARYSRDA